MAMCALDCASVPEGVSRTQADRIVVFYLEDDLLKTCEVLTEVKGYDGVAGDPTNVGTCSDALRRVRKTASRKGGNAVLITDLEWRLVTHPPASRVRVDATVLWCPENELRDHPRGALPADCK